MASLVNQPNGNLNPTNKLTAAIVASFAMELLRLLANSFWPGTVDESFWLAAYPLVVLGAGWFIRDSANVTTPVVVETPPAAEGEQA